MNKKGFTLVELISVLVIFSLIITIVATKGFGAFNNAKKSVCNQNLKTVKEAINFLKVEVENCNDDLKDYEELKAYFDNVNTNLIKSCSDLQEEIQYKDIKINELTANGYLNSNVLEDIDKDNLKFVFYRELNEENFKVENHIEDSAICYSNEKLEYEKPLEQEKESLGNISDIGKNIESSDVITCGKSNNQRTKNVKFILCDVDLNGIVNIRDTALVLQKVAGWNVGKYENELFGQSTNLLSNNKMFLYLADANQDGKLNKLDAETINQYIAGWAIETCGKETEINFIEVPEYYTTTNELMYCDLDYDNLITIKDHDLLEQEINMLQEDVIKGVADLNEDNLINKEDSEILLQCIANWDLPVCQTCGQEITVNGKKYMKCDISNDKKVNIRDAAIILQIEAGWDVTSFSWALDKTLTIIGDADGNGQITGQDVGNIEKFTNGEAITTKCGQYTDMLDAENIVKICGDIFEDDLVDNLDLIHITDYLKNVVNLTPLQKRKADINGDGVVTISDYTLLKNYLDSQKTNN